MKYYLKIFVVIYFILFASIECFSQYSTETVPFFKLTSLNGEIKLKGLYRDQTTYTYGLKNTQKSSFLYGGIMVKTQSYLWTPNFLALEIDGEFNPEKREEKYLIIPNQAEVNTMRNIHIKGTFFQQKKLNLGSYFNYDENYSSRENLSNLRTKGKSYGAFLNYSNKFLPFTLNYNQSNFIQKEIQTDRNFISNSTEVVGKFTKSFSGKDRHELTISHNEFDRKDADFLNINNKTNSAYLSDNVFFDKKQNYYFNSFISAIDQTGFDTYRRYQANENFNFKLPRKFSVIANYSFNRNERLLQTLNQHNANLTFGKKFYESLYTGVFYEYNNASHTSYKEEIHKAGIDLNYTKKLPTKGLLTLSYRYYRQFQNHTSGDIFLNVIREEYTLADGQFVLLTKPYVTPGTVVVTDITGTIIYQENLDYILINQTNNFTEIKRIPGGLIPNNSIVYVDYIAKQPGAYNFDASNQNFGASLMLFNRLVEVYYRYSSQDYLTINQTEYLTLNYFHQNVVGLRAEYKFASAGAEYDYYNSSIIPYKSMRYFAGLQGNIKQKFAYSLIGNLRNYEMINENLTQRYSDVTGSIAYYIKTKNKIKLDVGYMNQVGQGINLDLITAKTEFTTFYRKLYFTLGLEFYKRTYQGEDLDFKGGYVQISRKF
ncbi:MAG: hypothetical protein HXX09_01070 [Bacteroidetes bacterium]|nr:hypothetical protein [Bacteroidota bacterium]